jgi:two-component system nitrogen regulation response regulator NtrX
MNNMARSGALKDYSVERSEVLNPIIGSSDQIRSIKQKIARLKGQFVNVLLTGESGTGKELFARRIHSQERNPRRPFVAVNCAAIPDNLIESVLFGHEKGSFTGALERRLGKFELANGGDLFLDEISTLGLHLQAKLLRALENQEIERVGGNKTIKLNFRVISATNDDIEQLVAAGKFREDLYYRLRVVELRIEPLRARQQDIKMLLDYYLMLLCESGRSKRFSGAALKKLTIYSWPGNIRQLRNVVQTLIIFADSETISLSEVERELHHANGSYVAPEQMGESELGFKDAVDEFERQIIVGALKKNQWSRKKACLTLGITRNMLYRKIEALGIELNPV